MCITLQPGNLHSRYVNVSAFEKVLEQFSKEETATWLQWHYEDNKIRVYEKVTELAGERNSLKLLGYDFKKRKEVDFQGVQFFSIIISPCSLHLPHDMFSFDDDSCLLA